MRVGIGVSVGSEVVCSAMVVAHDDGTHTSEYRMISADDQANRDVGELVGSSIDLIVSLSPAEPVAAGKLTGRRRHTDAHAVAVVHRAETDAVRIRSVVGSKPRQVRMIPEADAALAFLDDAGLVASYSVVALVDLGASGTTVTVLDPASGTVFADERTDCATHSGDLDSLIVAVAGAAAQAGRVPDAVVLLGGGARTPAFAAALRRGFDMPIIELDEPDAMLAIGGALLAVSPERSRFPILNIEPVTKVDSAGRLASVLIGAVVVGGLVLAYGFQSLIPGDSSGVSPAGTVTNSSPSVVLSPASGLLESESGGSQATTPRSDGVDGYLDPGAPGPVGMPTIAVSTPSLRPDPNLPILEFPLGGAVNPPASAGSRPAEVPPFGSDGSVPAVTTPPVTAAPTTTVTPTTTEAPTTTPEPTTEPPTTTDPPSSEPVDPPSTMNPATATALVGPNTATSTTSTSTESATRTPDAATPEPESATPATP